MADQDENGQNPNQRYSFPPDERNLILSQEEERGNRQRIQHFGHGSPQMGMGMMHQHQQQHQRQQPPPIMGAISGLPTGFNDHYPASSMDHSRNYYAQGPVAYQPMNVYPNGQPLAIPRFDNNGTPGFINPYQTDGFSIAPEYGRPRENTYCSPNLPRPYYPEGQRAIPQMASSPQKEVNERNDDDQESEQDDDNFGNYSESEYKPSPVKNQTPRQHTGGKYPRKTVPETPTTSRKKTPRQGQSAKKKGAKPVWEGKFRNIATMKEAKAEREAKLITDTNNNRDTAAIPDENAMPLYAKRLFDAMTYTGQDRVDDHPRNNDDKPSQALNAIERGHWPASHIEERAWELLEALIDRGASFGVRLLPPFFKFPHENNARHGTFPERFDAIEDALYKSKATVKNVLDPQGHIDRLVDAPNATIRQKENNKRVNAQRDRQNKIGRTAIKSGISTAEELQEVLPPAEDEPQISEEDMKPVIKPQSSRKRPRPSTAHTPKVYNDSDENDDEDDESPMRKRTAGPNTRAQAARFAPVGGSAGKITGDNAMTLRRSKRNNPGPPPPPGMEDNYKAILAGLLGIDLEFARQYDLRDLRIYARAYYDSMSPWTHPDDNRWFSPRGPFLISDVSAGRKRHLAYVTDRFTDLAVERNDDMMDKDNVDFIAPVTTVPEKQALGMVDNPFGTIPGFYGQQGR